VKVSSGIPIRRKNSFSAIFQFYRILPKIYTSSERYIAIHIWGGGAFVSKDYGKHGSSFSPGENEPMVAYDDVLSFTVVNDQGFLQTKHRLYMSSRPFDDPRLLPGGKGIHYELGWGAGRY
jgi:hypothetical protein